MASPFVPFNTRSAPATASANVAIVTSACRSCHCASVPEPSIASCVLARLASTSRVPSRVSCPSAAVRAASVRPTIPVPSTAIRMRSPSRRRPIPSRTYRRTTARR